MGLGTGENAGRGNVAPSENMAPGLIVVVADFRFVSAFPVLNDGSEEDRLYRQNAERILLQSVAASTMSAHLAAAALGYAVVDNSDWPGRYSEEDQAVAWGARRACHHRRDVLWSAFKGFLQALEAQAGPDHELGPVSSGEFHDHGTNRGMDQNPAA